MGCANGVALQVGAGRGGAGRSGTKARMAQHTNRLERPPKPQVGDYGIVGYSTATRTQLWEDTQGGNIGWGTRSGFPMCTVPGRTDGLFVHTSNARGVMARVRHSLGALLVGLLEDGMG